MSTWQHQLAAECTDDEYAALIDRLGDAEMSSQRYQVVLNPSNESWSVLDRSIDWRRGYDVMVVCGPKGFPRFFRSEAAAEAFAAKLTEVASRRPRRPQRPVRAVKGSRTVTPTTSPGRI